MPVQYKALKFAITVVANFFRLRQITDHLSVLPFHRRASLLCFRWESCMTRWDRSLSGKIYVREISISFILSWHVRRFLSVLSSFLTCTSSLLQCHCAGNFSPLLPSKAVSNYSGDECKNLLAFYYGY